MNFKEDINNVGLLEKREKVILVLAYNRPEYFKEVVFKLSQCEDIREYFLLCCIEPKNKEVIDIAGNINFAERVVIVNDRVLGCSRNYYQGLTLGFSMTDYLVIVEDDICLAKDALKFFEWCNFRYKNDSSVYVVNAISPYTDDGDVENGIKRAKPCVYSKYSKDESLYLLNFWGWATWKDRWEEKGGMKEEWDFNYVCGGPDTHMELCLRKNRDVVYPLVPRSKNIGVEGIHMHQDFHDTWLVNMKWSDNLDCKDNFVEI